MSLLFTVVSEVFGGSLVKLDEGVMCVLEVAICFVGACFGISCGISVDGLHAHKRIVGLLSVECGCRACYCLVVCVESYGFVFGGVIVIVVFIPSLEFPLEVVDSIQKFGYFFFFLLTLMNHCSQWQYKRYEQKT